MAAAQASCSFAHAVFGQARSAPRPATFGQNAARAAPSRARRALVPRAAETPGGGPGVIDRPTTTPDVGKKKASQKAKPPTYRVLLHNDAVNKREYVVKVLLRVVEGFTVEDALAVMSEAHLTGLALVTQEAQDVAERYCESMRASGLVATVEPAGPGGAT